MKLGSFSKQPGERVSKSVIYTDALDPGDEIGTIDECRAEPAGLEVSPVLVAGDRARIWVSGGTDGVQYKITIKVTTAGGEILEDELFCRVKEI
ncbi:hypothetical protein [Thauera aromatica]|uniref:Uncharacterized protein n=1 Tax=Thauera aromatica K172 TaxID=44139 RepID=A0A2R4BNU3_THAAR|nr:hypothetical protein [Thauera aromatica]AVR89016.1 hypothetical protein Tharo_2113 [Thauera aromatica K172]